MKPGEHTLERVDDDEFVLTWIGEHPPWTECEWMLTLDELAMFERGENFVPANPVVFRDLDEQIARLRTRRDQIDARLTEITREFPGGFGD